MADYNINAVTRRVVFSGSAGTGPYAFTFEILDENDIAVYFNATLLTLTTDYTVSINANGTGSVTIVVGTNVPTTPDGDDSITIVGARDIERTTDFVTAGDFRASAINEQLDALTIFDQQISERVDRSIIAPVTDPTTIDMTLPAKADRLGKTLVFNSSTGNPEAGPTATEVTNAQTYANNASASADAAAADAATVAADKATVAADKATVAADKATTSGYKDAAATSASNAAASAAAAEVAKIEWQGTYNAGTAYALNDAVVYNGSSFICIQAGTGQTPAVGGTAYWDDLANKGADGAGSGDVNGPASSTDNAFARFDGTGGKTLQNSTGATLDDSGNATFTSVAGSGANLTGLTGRLVSVQTFTTSGANTWTKPAGITSVIAIVRGGGGGGGGVPTTAGEFGAGGGGEGGLAFELIDVTGTSSETATVGAGGAGGTSGGDGSAGSTSSFGAYVSATGGSGGGTAGATAGVPASGGAGGSGSGGSFNFKGCPGGTGVVPSASHSRGGIGGGAGASPANANNSAGVAASANTGGGGSGAQNINTTAYNGGDGGSGYVIVLEFK